MDARAEKDILSESSECWMLAAKNHLKAGITSSRTAALQASVPLKGVVPSGLSGGGVAEKEGDEEVGLASSNDRNHLNGPWAAGPLKNNSSLADSERFSPSTTSLSLKNKSV